MSRKPKQPKPEESTKEPSAEEIFQQLDDRNYEHCRLQLWNPQTKKLLYVLGDGKQSVLVDMKGNVRKAWKSLKSKLSKSTVEKLRKDTLIPKGLSILQRIVNVLKAYIHFDDQRLYLLLALWTIASYLYSVFSYCGYLFFYSKLWRSGKTRVFEILTHLAFNASPPLNAPTPPSIREYAAEGGTVQLDTIERWRQKNPESYAAAMDILDAGFRKGGMVVKQVQFEKNWVREEYPVYTPITMAGINKDSLTDTALDRSFVIEMERKPPSLKKRKYRYDKCEKECGALRNTLYAWALRNASQVSQVYLSTELEKEVDRLRLHDRAADIWLPIFAVARSLGHDADSAEWAALTSLAQEMGRDPEAAEEIQNVTIIKVLRSKVTDDRVVAKSEEIFSWLKEEGIQISFLDLNHLLKQWGFKQKSIRLPEGPRSAWELKDAALEVLEEELVSDVTDLEELLTPS